MIADPVSPAVAWAIAYGVPAACAVSLAGALLALGIRWLAMTIRRHCGGPGERSAGGGTGAA